MITVYGIRQCDTCRKALKWLDAQGLAHEFHDLRVDGLDAKRVAVWMDSAFLDRLVNRRSTTWRGLSEQQKQSEGLALRDLLVEHPTLLKRPLFEVEGQLRAVGFQPDSLRADLA